MDYIKNDLGFNEITIEMMDEMIEDLTNYKITNAEEIPCYEIIDDEIIPPPVIPPLSIDIEKKIKHIVFSGGGAIGISGYSVLKESNIAGFWDLKNIESMYSTSTGSIFCLAISLGFDWDVLDDYILKRPWHNVFKIDIFSIIQSLKTAGILNKKVIDDIFEPLFKSKDIKMDITMKELYELTNIDFHVFITQLNPLLLIDISHTTHPDWTVLESIYCSCCLPILFIPYEKDSITYLDGGLLLNYPIFKCHENNADIDEILGILIHFKTETTDTNNEYNLFHYLFNIINNMITKINIPIHIDIPNELIIESDTNSFYKIYLAASNIDERKRLMNDGIELWKTFQDKNKNS